MSHAGTRHPIRWAALAALCTAASAVADPGRRLDVTAAGAAGDGTTVDTAAIQRAIDTCGAAGGGTVGFPPGRYLSGTVQIKSGVTLHLDAGATLLGSPDSADYRNLDPFTDGSGNPMGHALVVAVDADRVGLEGPGTIDGQGLKVAARQHPYVVRPFLVRWVRCTHVAVRDVHLANPGSWTLNFFRSADVLVDSVTIRSRDQKLRNNDGVNIDSCQRVRVQHCDVVSGDDALVLKSTGPAVCRDVTASDCQLSTRTNAIKLGTESYGGFADVTVSHCRVTTTEMAGIALYAVDGGDLQRVTVSDVTMDGVAVPIAIRLGSRSKTFRPGDPPKPTGTLGHTTIRNVTATHVGLIGLLINGVPGHPVENLTLDHVDIHLPGGGTARDAQRALPEKASAYPEFDMFGKTMPAYGLYARHVRGLTLRDVRLTPEVPDARPPMVLIDVTQVAGPAAPSRRR